MTPRDGEEDRAEREAAFEGKREELLRDRDELVSTAKDYLRRNLFLGQAKNTVSSILGKLAAYGETVMTDPMWRALAGCVAYVDIRDEEGDDDNA